jgi:hypothetical protein
MRYLLLFMLAVGVVLFGKSIFTDLTHSMGGVVGEGEIITKRKELSSFDGINLSLVSNIKVYKSNEPAIEIKTYENIQKLLSPIVQNKTLEIEMDGRFSLNQSIEIKIFTENLEDIYLSGASEVELMDVFEGEKLNVHISGVSSLQTADVRFEQIDCEVSGSGSITLNGSADKLYANISGVGEIHNEKLKVRTCEARVSGAGSVHCNVSEDLDASVSGVGSVLYKGNPRVSQSVSGAGSVKNLD